MGMRYNALANGPPVARSDAQERLEREARVAPTAEAVAVMNGGRAAAGALAAA